MLREGCLLDANYYSMYREVAHECIDDMSSTTCIKIDMD